jgi:uncharacterized protein (DUF983 family)
MNEQSECELCGCDISMMAFSTVGHRCSNCDEEITEKQCKDGDGHCLECTILEAGRYE